MDNVFHGLLCKWSSAELQVVLQLILQDARAPQKQHLAYLLLHDLVWIDLVEGDFGRELLWIDALEAAVHAPEGPTLEVWRRALAIGTVWMSLTAQFLLFGDSHAVYHIFCTRPPPQAEVQRMLPIIWRHLDAWARRHYRDPAQFVAAVCTDWLRGNT